MMKKIALTAIALSALLQSCGNKTNASRSTYKNTVALGKFYDLETPMTFDETKVSDLPRSVNLINDMSSVKNQGDRGACTFFSTAAMLEATVKKDMNVDVNFSEEFMSHVTKELGYLSKSEGSTVWYNIFGIDKAGLMLERDFGYQPSWFAKGLPCEKFSATDESAPKECFSHHTPDAETLQKVIKTTDAVEFTGLEKDTNDVIRFLAEEKRPLTVTVVVNYNGWPDSGETFYDETLREECLSEQQDCGLHSVLITGYDLDKGVFFFKNSWSKRWGKDGYGTMTIASFDRYADKELFFAKLKDKLIIPVNANESFVALKKVSTQANRAGDKIQMKVSAEVSGVKGHMIYVSSYFTEMKPGETGAPSAENTQLMKPTEAETTATRENYVRAIHYVTNPTDTLTWTDSAPLELNFVEGTEATIKSILNSVEKSFIRTTIYVHTDEEDYKILDRSFLAL